MRLLLLLVFLGLPHALLAGDVTIPLSCRQLVVVETADWRSVTGTLRKFERTTHSSPWRQAGLPLPVALGRRGLAWGLGMHQLPAGVSRKQEGDERAPAGLFALSSIWGSATAASAGALRLPYRQAQPTTEAVDDPRSAYYNTIVDRQQVTPDWRSAEKMLRKDSLYELVIVVDHNTAGTPGAGSCIFMHRWLGPKRGTAGCTAMAPEELLALAQWLDATAHPLLLQLPAEEMRRVKNGPAQ
ncbi:MAG TPA: L,D-transpeptidase family protein [Chthoniobacteraceae bacterium]